MAGSIWSTDIEGRLAVSINQTMPGPVVGHLLASEDGGWFIEDDESGGRYSSPQAGADEIVRRHQESAPKDEGNQA